MPTVTLANGRSFPAPAGASILDAALAAGIVLEHSCRTGRCGACLVEVMSGHTAALRDELSLAPDAAARGCILSCVRVALSDVSLDAEDFSALAGITPKTLPCRINALTRLSPDVMRVELRLPPNSQFAFRAGQYLDIIGPGGAKRSYSIASDANRADRLELHVRRVDAGTMSAYWFESARVNDLLRFRGPLGTFILRDVAGLHLIFLATGTGYAPIQSMLLQLSAMNLAERPASVSVVWGNRFEQDVYADPTRVLADVEFTPVLSRAGLGWHGIRGHVQHALLADEFDLAQSAVYACGSDAMITSARTALTAAGLPAKRFYADAFVSSS